MPIVGGARQCGHAWPISSWTMSRRTPVPRRHAHGPHARVAGEGRRAHAGRRRVPAANDRGRRVGPRVSRAPAGPDRGSRLPRAAISSSPRPSRKVLGRKSGPCRGRPGCAASWRCMSAPSGRPTSGEVVSVWLRDGWSCGRRDVDNEARRPGRRRTDACTFICRRRAPICSGATSLDVEAARQVLEHYGVPASPEGRGGSREHGEPAAPARSRTGMRIVRDVLRAATVLQGGGTEVFGEGLSEKLKTGAGASLAPSGFRGSTKVIIAAGRPR